MVLCKVGQSLGHALHDMRRRSFQFQGDAFNFLHQLAARHISGKFQIRVFQGAAKTAHSIAVLPDIAAFRFIENVTDVFGGVAEVFELRDKVRDRLLEENIVFPESVVRVYEQSVARHGMSRLQILRQRVE